MDTRQKKTTRDLSDLKSRLGLAKPTTGTANPAVPAPTAQPDQAASKPTGPAYQAVQAASAASPSQAVRASLATPGAAMPRVAATVAPPGMVVPPPGMVVPPPGMGGYAQPQPQQPPPDPRRDPFAGSGPQQTFSAAHIVDAGPLIEIPQEKKSHTKLLVALAITAAIPLLVGYAGGRIWAARRMFNQTIDDAKNIEESVKRLSSVNQKVAVVIAESQKRSNGRIAYDEKLLEGLKEVLRAAPIASPERAKHAQDELFRTNYAMMDGIVVDRLFNYFNNSLRLYQELETFIQKAERTKELVEAYSPDADKGLQKYGIVLASDEGKYFLGSLVEVGNIVCSKPEAKECKKDDIKGFMVRVGSGSWSSRPGKPEKRNDISEIVIPITPDENWQRVAVGKKGFMEYREYAGGVGRLMAICGLLSRDEKPLYQDLGKAGGRTKVFAPACSYSPASAY